MIVFHDHLDGGLRPETLLELSLNLGYKPIIDLNLDDLKKLLNKSNSASLEDFLSAFTHTISVMQSFDNIERISFEAAEDMFLNGIKYYESRYAPLYSVNDNLSPLDVIDAINSGFNKAYELYGIKSGLIVCGMRNDPKDVKKLTELACTNIKNNIIGFDIAGPEIGYPPSNYNKEFRRLKENNINLTIHGGEGAGVEYIQEALDSGADRIGHGVRIIEDIDISQKPYKLGKTSKEILERNIMLEICISSNIHTKMYKSVYEHPIKVLYDLGFNISVNTDNRLMSNTSMKKELALASSIGINKKINDDKLPYSFLS